MRSISKFAGTICKTKTRYFHISNCYMRMWNKMSNDVKVISFVLFKVYIKTMLINMYCMTSIFICISYNYITAILYTTSINFSRKL